MKLLSLSTIPTILTVLPSTIPTILTLTSAFSYQSPNLISLSSTSNPNNPNHIPRSQTLDEMTSWAESYGVQQCEGFTLHTYDNDDTNADYFAATTVDLPAGSPVVFVPSGMVLTSYNIAHELSELDQLNGSDSVSQAEEQLTSAGLSYKLPLFRLFLKILLEYSSGETSPYHPWLNSLPKTYNNGASMTYACFDCLPPYAAWLALGERQNFVNFQKAVKYLEGSLLSEEIVSNIAVLRWAYNVARTRSTRLGTKYNTEYFIAPLADMFNHASTEDAVNAELTLDEEGNCVVYTTQDVPANTPLSISYGPPQNPSPLFAKYGFLDDSSPATFCKLIHRQEEMEALGYDYNQLLFYKETGEISPEVWDVKLYSLLLENDPDSAQAFLAAHHNGDESTKAEFHNNYFPYTHAELKQHVETTLKDLATWSAKAKSYDVNTHPRVPVILKHNEFVRGTFERVKFYLDQMA